MGAKIEEKGGCLYKFGQRFAVGGENIMPDAMLIAILLILIVFVSGVVFTDTTPIKMIEYGFGSIWNLSGFCISAALSMVFATVLAQTKIMTKLLNGLCSIPKTNVQVIMFGCLLSAIAMYINWAIAYVVGGLYCCTVVKKVKNVDYPLLVASCYATDMIWHSGMSGTIPLVASTEGSFVANIVGYVIPVSETMFSPLNLTFCTIITISLPFVARALIPPKNEAVVVEFDVPEEHSFKRDKSITCSFAQRMEYSRFFTVIIGVGLAVYCVIYFKRTGLDGLTLDALNLVLLALAFLLVQNVREFVAHAPEAVKSATSILTQYPFYACILGMTTQSGIAALVAQFFVSICNANNLPNVLHLSASIVNLFIPSAGSQFAVEAPMYIPAAQELGVSIPTVMNVCAMGDALTNLVQPMWALPFLAYAKLPVKKIIGYCFIFCVYGFIISQILIAIFVRVGLA